MIIISLFLVEKLSVILILMPTPTLRLTLFFVPMIVNPQILGLRSKRFLSVRYNTIDRLLAITAYRGEMSSGAENCVKQNSALNGSRAALADTPKFLILP